MSAVAMFRKCGHCGKKFTYNPSAGDMGLICPHCNKPANIGQKGSILPEIGKLLNKVSKP